MVHISCFCFSNGGLSQKVWDYDKKYSCMLIIISKKIWGLSKKPFEDYQYVSLKVKILGLSQKVWILSQKW